MFQSMMGQVQSCQKFTVVRKTTINYLLYLPSGYEQDNQKKFPLLIFLHGSGERGDSLPLVKKNGPPSFIENRPDFPFITVSPQCPKGTWWVIEDLQAMLEQLKLDYRIDTNRMYLTGLSMGGFGTWAWASKFPKQFAAIAPVCGGGDVQFADKLKDIPIWAFHGEADTIVPMKRTKEMVEAINAKGGNARCTIYPAVGHNSWEQAYNEKELFTWLLSNTRSKKTLPNTNTQTPNSKPLK